MLQPSLRVYVRCVLVNSESIDPSIDRSVVGVPLLGVEFGSRVHESSRRTDIRMSERCPW